MRLTAALALLLSGCAAHRPERAPWNEQEPVLKPARPSSACALTVETEASGRLVDGVPMMRAFYLFAADGAYLTYFINERAEEVGLAPGRYVVVSRVRGVDRRVQVLLEPGSTTAVTRRDLEAAPFAR